LQSYHFSLCDELDLCNLDPPPWTKKLLHVLLWKFHQATDLPSHLAAKVKMRILGLLLVVKGDVEE
jgi:hypothetical protein